MHSPSPQRQQGILADLGFAGAAGLEFWNLKKLLWQ
jgi:hypothetical protein